MSLNTVETIDCTATFVDKSQLIFEIKENHFYGFLPTKMIQIFYAEHYSGTYGGDSDDEENQCHYMVWQTEYFPLDKVTEAWKAFVNRLKSAEPWKATGDGFQLHDFCQREPVVEPAI